MATLQEGRYDEVLQLVNSFTTVSGELSGRLLEFIDDRFLSGNNPLLGAVTLGGKIQILLDQLGFKADVVATQSNDLVNTLLDLYSLVRQGQITPDEADAFLRRHYAREFKGRFADISERSTDKAATEVQALPDADEEAQSTSEQAETVQNDQGIGTLSGTGSVLFNPGSFFGLGLGSLPEDYSPDDVASVLEGAFDVVGRNLSRVAGGEIRIRAGSISGSAIIPGTLPSTALDIRTFGLQFQALPDAEQAVVLNLRHSDTIDRYATETVASVERDGPGRVWSVSNFVVPTNWQPTRGKFRYRVIVPNQRFSVFSVRPLSDAAEPEWEVTYGMVISGIPWFGNQPPQRVEYVGVEGDPCGAFQAVLGAGGSNFFEPQTQDDFETNPPVAYLPFGNVAGTSGFCYPLKDTPDYLKQVRGFTAQVVTGQTTQQVFEEMNTLTDFVGTYISGEGVRLWGSCPPGEPVRAPTVAGLYDNNPVYSPRTLENVEAGAVQEILIGAPFAYDDLSRLRFQESRFAMVLLISPSRVVPSTSWTGAPGVSSGTNDMRLSTWWETGLFTVAQNARKLAFDVVVG